MTFYIPFILLVIILLISVVYLNRQTKESFGSFKNLQTGSDISVKKGNYAETIHTYDIDLTEKSSSKICIDGTSCINPSTAVSIFYNDLLNNTVEGKLSQLDSDLDSIEYYNKGTMIGSNPSLLTYLNTWYDPKSNVYTKNVMNDMFIEKSKTSPELTRNVGRLIYIPNEDTLGSSYLTQEKAKSRYYRIAPEYVDDFGSNIPQSYITRTIAGTELAIKAYPTNPYINYSYLSRNNDFRDYSKGLKETLDKVSDEQTQTLYSQINSFALKNGIPKMELLTLQYNALARIATMRNESNYNTARVIVNTIKEYHTNATHIISILKNKLRILENYEEILKDPISSGAIIQRNATTAHRIYESILSDHVNSMTHVKAIESALTSSIVQSELDKCIALLNRCKTNMSNLDTLDTETQTEFIKLLKHEQFTTLSDTFKTESIIVLELQKIYLTLYKLFQSNNTITCELAFINAKLYLKEAKRYMNKVDTLSNKDTLESSLNEFYFQFGALQTQFKNVLRFKNSAQDIKNNMQSYIVSFQQLLQSRPLTSTSLDTANTYKQTIELLKPTFTTAFENCMEAHRKTIMHFKNCKDIYDQLPKLEAFTSYEEEPNLVTQELYDDLIQQFDSTMEETLDFKNVFLKYVSTPFKIRFTNAGQTGPTGPSFEQCVKTYNPQNIPTHWVNQPTLFKVNQGVQQFTIQETGSYTFTIAGAKGGGTFGGKGEIGTTTTFLQKGDVIQMVVGQAGSIARSTLFLSGGGGGASYVVCNTDKIIGIAAGGGGTFDYLSEDAIRLLYEKTPDAGIKTLEFKIEVPVTDQKSNAIQKFLNTKLYKLQLPIRDKNLLHGGSIAIYQLTLNTSRLPILSDGKGLQLLPSEEYQTIDVPHGGAGGGYLTHGIGSIEQTVGKSFVEGKSIGGGGRLHTTLDSTEDQMVLGGSGGFGGGGGGGFGGGGGGSGGDSGYTIGLRESATRDYIAILATAGIGGTSYQLRHIGYNNASHGFIELVKHSSYITHYKNQYLYSIQGLLLEEHLYTICIRHLKPDYNGSVSKDQLNMAMEKLKKIVDFDRSSFDTHVTIYLQKGIFDFTETEVHVSGIQPDINIHNEIMTLFKFNILNRIKTIERMIVDMVSYIKILFAEDTQEDFTNRSSKTNPFMIHPKYFNL